ncbi:transposase (plasmid) [Rhizobium leguminosarum]
MLISVRTRLIANRTQLANAIRGYANEFGVSAAKGLAHIPMLLERIQADATVPELAQELFMSQAEEYAQLEKKIADVEAKVKAWQRNDERSRRPNTIPGIGPIGSALLIMKTPAPELFQSGRQFAAWIGLTPKDHSTGGTVMRRAAARRSASSIRVTPILSI